MIFPLNETRPRQPYAITEYFVDKRRYHNLLLCHWLVGVYLSFFVLITTITLHIVYIEHICGMLSVASYRIQHSIDHYVSHNPPKKEDVIFQNINVAVDLHRKALMCSLFLSTAFASDFFFTIVLSVLSFSLNLLRLIKVILLLKNISELLMSIILVSAHFVIIFLEHYYGQKITNHNDKIFYNAYNTEWYTVPVRIQKLFLFIMKNTTKAYVLNIGNFIMASLEGFTKLMSLSISYFTVMYSLQ
ncbi:odorant receptor 94a-like [Harpegnathos saltator]|uniref:odorant receptor 94a-like n=1 Tax=Harpegnathos saltator TaxID=610380 RepID=UPI000DBEECC8|nr:odorant receptor 94a-like [Harpegnathos saltator]